MLQPTTAKYQKVNIPAFIGGVFPIYVCAFLLGIIIYFALPFEPRLGHILLLSIALFVLAGGLYYFEHHKTRIISGYAWGYWGFNFIFILGITAVGILYSAHYTQQQNTPFWPQAFAQKTVWLNGQLEAIKHRQNKYAVLTITNVTTYHKDRVRTWPKMVITVHEKRLNNEKVGAHIAAQVQLRPPTTSLRPSTYDWQRRSYFEGTSAVGFVMGQFYITPQQVKTVHAKLRTIR